MKNFKKFFGIFLSLAMVGTIVACKKTPAHECEDKCPICGKCTTDCTDPACAEKCTCEPAKTYDVEAAKDIIFQTYKNTTSTTASYDLNCQVQIGDDYYPVTWALTVKEGGDASCISLGTPANHVVTVTINRDKTVPTVDTEYTLKYTVTDPEGKNPLEGTFTRTVPAFKYATFAEIKAACDAANGSNTEETFDFKGILVGKSGLSSGKVQYAYVANEEGALCAYNLTCADEAAFATLGLGAEVIVSGNCVLYQGTYEFAAGCTFEVVTPAPETYEPEFFDLTEAFKAATNVKADLVNYQNRLVKLTGVTLGNIGSNNYQYFELDGLESYIRCSSSSNYWTGAWEGGSQAFYDFFKADWTKGYKADIAGILCCYSGNHYIMPVLATEDYYKVTEKTLTDEVKAENTAEEIAAIFEEEYVGNAEVTLPAVGITHTNVTLTYAVKEGATASVEITEGKLSVNGEVEGTATIVVTATCGEAVKTAEATISVKLPQPISLAEFITTADTENKSYVQGIVVAVNNVGASTKFVLSDGTAAVFCNEKLAVKPGDEVLLSAKYSNYYGASQIANVALLKVVSENHTETGKFTAVTAAEIAQLKTGYTGQPDAAAKAAFAATVTGKAYKVTGFVAASGSYYNIYDTAEKANCIVETTFNETLTAAVKALLGEATAVEVDVYGYVKSLKADGTPQAIVVAVVAKGGEYTPVPFDVNSVITSEALGLTNSYVDGDPEKPATIGKAKWTFVQTSDYGDGIQMRTNSKGDSAFWNVTPMVEDITKVHFVYSSTKTPADKADIIEVIFSKTADFAEGTTESVKVSTAVGTTEYDALCTLKGARYVKILHTKVSGALYWASITVCC